MHRPAAILGFLCASVPMLSNAQGTCRMRSFDEVACSTPNGLKTSVTATNEKQLDSVGCVSLSDKPTVRVIERFGDVTKVTITTKNSIIPFWVKTYALDCTSGSPGKVTPQFRSAYEQTSDGFVWKGGKRIGWVDDNSATFYLADQIVIVGSTKPIIKVGSTGIKILTNLDAAILGADQAAATPPEASLERTADGIVWRGGKRIGWIDPSASTYYRVDQIDFGPDKSARPKQGAVGMPVEQGRVLDAVVRAERSE